MGTAKYIGRVGGLAVALGVGHGDRHHAGRWRWPTSPGPRVLADSTGRRRSRSPTPVEPPNPKADSTVARRNSRRIRRRIDRRGFDDGLAPRSRSRCGGTHHIEAARRRRDASMRPRQPGMVCHRGMQLVKQVDHAGSHQRAMRPRIKPSTDAAETAPRTRRRRTPRPRPPPRHPGRPAVAASDRKQRQFEQRAGGARGVDPVTRSTAVSAAPSRPDIATSCRRGRRCRGESAGRAAGRHGGHGERLLGAANRCRC